MTEHLRGFRTAQIEGIDYRQMIANSQVISQHVLADELKSALQYLTTTPGEHLKDRQRTAPDWLAWWIDFLDRGDSSHDLFTPSSKLLSIDQIEESLKRKGGTSGLLFVAGAEGHVGHRFSGYWMKKHVDHTIWLFEQEDYLKNKTREGSFLPLEIRLSMWNYHPDIGMIGVSTTADVEDNINNHYQTLFNHTGADYCFATEDDPNHNSKIQRGKRTWFTTIPLLKTPSTTDMVRKLLPDIYDTSEVFNPFHVMKDYGYWLAGNFYQHDYGLGMASK